VLDQWLGLMLNLTSLGAFLELGGPVLLLVIGAGFFMWLLIIERLIYILFGLPQLTKRLGHEWQSRSDHGSAHAHWVRQGLMAELKLHSQRSLYLIRTLVALAPLLGLLGTVTGMLEVFEVMAQSGSSNARAMASGIARATIPTMAGMVLAITGLYASSLLNAGIERRLGHTRFAVLPLEGRPHAQIQT
jgi:biopolymer transport protein ExbB